MVIWCFHYRFRNHLKNVLYIYKVNLILRVIQSLKQSNFTYENNSVTHWFLKIIIKELRPNIT